MTELAPAPAVAGASRVEPVSWSQERLWLAQQVDPDSPLANVVLPMPLPHGTSREDLVAAVATIVARHEPLRTTFRAAGPDGVEQVVHDAVHGDLVHDVPAGLDVDSWDEVRATGTELSREPVGLLDGLPWRVWWCEGDSGPHVIWLLHHAIADGESVAVLQREVDELCEAAAEGRAAELPELAHTYSDAVRRQRAAADEAAADVAWFVDHLAGAPHVHALPLDRPRRRGSVYRPELVLRRMPPGTAARVGALARTRRTTPFVVALALWGTLIGRLSGQPEVVVGVPVAGRDAGDAGLVGMFVNTLPLRLRVPAGASLAEVIDGVRDEFLQAWSHAQAPLHHVVAAVGGPREASVPPLYQIGFNHLGVTDVGHSANGGAEEDVALHLSDRWLRLNYNPALLDAATAESLVDRYLAVVGAALADPSARVDDLPLVTAAEMALFERVNDTARERAPGLTLTALSCRPDSALDDSPAIVAADGSDGLTRAQWRGRVDAAAARLAAAGVGAGDVVGLSLARSVEMVGLVHAVARLGAAWLPLDPTLPLARREFMVGDAGARVVVGEPVGSPICLSTSDVWCDGPSITAATLPDVAPDAPAYVLYTSGSTGQPKGVLTRQPAITNRLEWMQEHYQLQADDVVLHKTPPSFDVSVWELWWSFQAGASLVVLGAEDHKDPAAVRDAIERHGVTTVHFVPSMLAAFVEVAGLERLTSLRRIICSGEQLAADTVAAVHARLPQVRIDNLYGPTEAAIDVTAWRCVPGDPGPVPIGTPIDNVRVSVLDDAGRPVPVGALGQLHLHGVQVAEGYLNRPELTDALFTHDDAGWHYATGDLVRWRRDGALVHEGRIDSQVKLRGQRLELGEIEAVLRAQPGVVAAAADVREIAPGDQRLVAWVVGEADLDAARDVLPAYMVPQVVASVDALPLGTTGKLDRRALPTPEVAVQTSGRAPRPGVEERVAAVYGEVLGIDDVDADTDFFAAGGHSLLAMRVLARLREAEGHELPLRVLFDHPTVAELAAALGGEEAQEARQPIARRDPALTELPLTRAQERVWFLQRYDPDDAEFVVPIVRVWRGTVDAEALQAAIDVVVARHEALRMRFVDVDGSPRAEVVPEAQVELVRGHAADVEQALAEARVLAATPIDLSRAPLARAHWWRVDDETSVLAVTMHHIVSDGVSMVIFMDELAEAYGAAVDGRPAELPSLAIGYGDVGVDEASRGVDEAALDFWRAELDDVKVLDLPTDLPRPASRTSLGASVRHTLPAAALERLERVARQERATLFHVLMGAWQAWLGRCAGTDDVCVGTPLAGRERVETEPLIGYFLSTVVLRGDLSGAPTLRQLTARTRDRALAAFGHSSVPFEDLLVELDVERDPSRTPLFQSFFTLQSQGAERRELPGVVAEVVVDAVAQARTDLTLEAWRAGEDLVCQLVYPTALFRHETMTARAAEFVALLERWSADPDAALPTLLLGREAPPEWEQGPGLASVPTVLGEVANRADEQPDAVAVRAPDGVLTRAELWQAAGALARALRAAGVRSGHDDVVAVVLDHSVDLVVAMLGCWRAGAAYLPVDPALPETRRDTILASAAAGVVIARDLVLPGRRVVAPRPDRAPEADGAPLAVPGPDDLAYVIYTSGSTGTPKGVEVTHANVAARVAWMRQNYGVGPDDVVLQFASPSFDTHVEEVHPALAAGAQLLLPPGPRAQLADWLRTGAGDSVTILDLPTPFWHDLVGAGDTAWPPRTRLCILGADQAQAGAVAAWREQTGGVRLVNSYGPTETTVIATACDLQGEADGSRPPIGRPIGDTWVRVVDAVGAPALVGVPGELRIGGAGVARGYRGQPELTAERFIQDDAGRCYLSGDLVRWRADGQIEFLGRTDDQVKIRGYRVEPAEVEAQLRRLPGVRDAVVLPHGSGVGRVLLGYVVPTPSADPTEDQLRDGLRAVMPDYLVPARVVTIPAIPLTPTGKIDRRALPVPEVAQERAATTAPRTPTEQAVAAIWGELLGLEDVGVDEDFFALGGHSLLATKLVARLRGLAGAPGQVSVMDVFRTPTVADLAALLDTGASGGAEGVLHELTSVPVAQRRLTVVAVPYGGSSAVVYQPLADALPDGVALLSASIHGHDTGREDEPLDIKALGSSICDELMALPEGPLVLYGHAGVGCMIAVDAARKLAQRGRRLDAVYLGAVFPFARPKGMLRVLSQIAHPDRLWSNRTYQNRLKANGVDLADLDRAERDRIINNLRQDTIASEDYGTELMSSSVEKLPCPVIAVVGERDRDTLLFADRYQEWEFLSDDVALAVVDEGGHYFPRHRAPEVAEIVTTVHPAVADRAPITPSVPGWHLHGTHRPSDTPPGPRPSMRRFGAVLAGQLVALIGSAVTSWALPLWIYMTTGSVFSYTLFVVLGMVPGLVLGPVLGALIDRMDRRKVLIAAALAGGVLQGILAALVWQGQLQVWHVYLIQIGISAVISVQRVGFLAAIGQLAPRQFMGHAMGAVQLINSLVQTVVPLFAVALYAAIGLRGIVLIDVASFVALMLILLAVAFPRLAAWHTPDSFLTELVDGFRIVVRAPGLGAIMLYFIAFNLFLAAPFVLVSPLVLSFAGLPQVSLVAFVQGLAGVIAAFLVLVWGGPSRRRVEVMLALAGVMSVAVMVVGLRPSIWLVAAGLFGVAATLAMQNGIFATVIQTKVPQRFHGRVFAMTQMISWSTLPLGFLLIAPWGTALLEPLLAPGGALAPTVGRILGVGPGRGIGLLYVLCGIGMLLATLVAVFVPVIRTFDRETGAALNDDEAGLLALRGQRPDLR